MTSILTNNGAMVALQTLNSINSNLTDTQNQISTGKKVGNAQDNSAVWAISKVMESDVQGFEAISSSLALGDSTVAVARNAAESITDALIEIKDKIISAQEGNVDRDKLQEDIVALRDQITSIAGAAQFNGLNLLSNTDTTAGSDSISILSSLDRASDGSVTATNIDVSKQDLGTAKHTVDTNAGTATFAAGAAAAAATLDNANQTQDLTIAAGTVAAGTAFGLHLDATDADDSTFTEADYEEGGALASAGTISYVAREGDTAADVAQGLKDAWDLFAGNNNLDTDVLDFSVQSGGVLRATSTVTDATDTIAVAIDTVTSVNNTVGGGLAALTDIDVSTESGAEGALKVVESLIDTATDSAAAFGSAAGRIESQSMFVSKLTDSLKSGIGSLVDADMEAASARLKALQTQQQLGVQALTIANSAPSTLQQLFR